MPFGAFAPLPLRLGGSAEEGWSPEQHARLCADLRALKRVMPLASWDYDQTSDSVVTLTNYVGQNGVGLAYAPTATANGTGDVSCVWPSPYFEDEYEAQHPFKVRAVIATNASAVDGSVTVVWEQITRGVRLRMVDNAPAAYNGKVCVRVW